jgi:tetratricopeptide (TPR) repeat protein
MMNDAVHKPSDSTPAPRLDWSDKSYLIVDDFSGVRRMLREHLKKLGAKRIDDADNGSVAMRMIGDVHYDVVLCDYHLEDGRNGHQLLEEARARHLLKPSAIWVMVSAERSVESVMGAIECQPDAYLLKPFTEGSLLTRLERARQHKDVFREIDAVFVGKDYLRAAKLCDAQIAANPLHEVELLRMKATLMLKSGETVQARKIYEDLLSDGDYQWARAGLGKIDLKDGNFDGARRRFQQVLTENRYYMDAYDQLALAYQSMGLADEAGKVLESAVKLSPNSVTRQRTLGQVALQAGNVVLAERAFRKCIAIGEHSVNKTPDAYLGLARVCAMKNEPEEAMRLLSTVQKEFSNEDLELRAKIAEGMVFHESGDYRRARLTAEELARTLASSQERPDTATCLEMATLMFIVGIKEAPIELLCYLIRNNHDNAILLDDVRRLFAKARMRDEGELLTQASRKSASGLMDEGVLLWKNGKEAEAVAWTRDARKALPNNLRVLFNAAQILISSLQQNGYNAELATEANDVLMHIDRIAPGHQRFAQLFEQLSELSAKAAASNRAGLDF